MEQAITSCVQRFCDKARNDPVLGPVFASWPGGADQQAAFVHVFWSQALSGAGPRQGEALSGEAFACAGMIALRRDHFRCWLDIFTETALEALPAAQAEEAIARAPAVSDRFQAALTSVVRLENIVACRPA